MRKGGLFGPSSAILPSRDIWPTDPGPEIQTVEGVECLAQRGVHGGLDRVCLANCLMSPRKARGLHVLFFAVPGEFF